MGSDEQAIINNSPGIRRRKRRSQCTSFGYHIIYFMLSQLWLFTCISTRMSFVYFVCWTLV